MTSSAPLGKGDLFHTKGLDLPGPVRKVARALMREEGFAKSHAIATALSRGRRWAAGGNAKWAKAMAEWDAARATARATPNRGERVDASRPHTTQELLMALPPQFQKGKKGAPPKGGKKGPPRKIANATDVAAAAGAVSKVPAALQGKAQARVKAAARAVAGGMEALNGSKKKKPGNRERPPFPPKK